jgi:hypothetical protein
MDTLKIKIIGINLYVCGMSSAWLDPNALFPLETRVKTAHVHPATWNLSHWLTRHGSRIIYLYFALPELLYRWRNQSGIFWINPRK